MSGYGKPKFWKYLRPYCRFSLKNITSYLQSHIKQTILCLQDTFFHHFWDILKQNLTNQNSWIIRTRLFIHHKRRKIYLAFCVIKVLEYIFVYYSNKGILFFLQIHNCLTGCIGLFGKNYFINFSKKLYFIEIKSWENLKNRPLWNFGDFSFVEKRRIF